MTSLLPVADTLSRSVADTDDIRQSAAHAKLVVEPLNAHKGK